MCCFAARCWPTDDGESSLREAVNSVLDAINATLQRVLELPLFGVFLVVSAVAAVLLVASHRLQKKGRRTHLRILLRSCAVLLILSTPLLVLDRRLLQQQQRLDGMWQQNTAVACAFLDELRQQRLLRSQLNFDEEAAKSALERSFSGVALRTVVLDDATDLVLFHLNDPLVSGALAIVDLQSPSVQIAMDADFETKTLTSDFGAARHCTVAINGEAGRSPQPNCGLGSWCGYLVIDGDTLLVEKPGNPRPFLSFDRTNRARFVSAGEPTRELGCEDYNVIWGRVDTIVGGEIRTAPYRFNQPRTVMGIDQEGTHLFLLVVDGRQPQRSVGFTHEQVGEFLRAFLVHDAMLCDEGGSSCMFAAQFGGLVTVPSDNHGEERRTYTHFGIQRRPVAVTSGR